jgi:KDO2-lipid IV(A) lauroyltransferase
MPALVRAGPGLGVLLHAVARARAGRWPRATSSCACRELSRRRSASAILREHFALLGRSLVERALLWYAPLPRLREAHPRRGRHRPGRAPARAR